MEEIIGYMAAAVYLAGSGIEDLKKHSVPAWWLFQGMAAGMMWRMALLCSGKSDGKEFVMCFLPGAGLLLIKRLSEAVGGGDGIAWIGICMLLGIKTGLIVLAITFGLFPERNAGDSEKSREKIPDPVSYLQSDRIYDLDR